MSWAPVVELAGLRLDTLDLEGDTLYAAATPASGGVKIYALDRASDREALAESQRS